MNDDLGQVAYTAYAKDCDYKSIRGEDLPVWQDQDPAIQAQRAAAAKAVVMAVAGDGG